MLSKINFSVLAVFSVIVFFSCSDDKEPSKTVVSFSSTASEVDEDDGTVDITVTLSKALSEDLELEFSLGGSAVAGIDYEVESLSSPFTIPAGETSFDLEITIFNDPYIELEDELVIELSSGNKVKLGESIYTLTINDNDEVGDGALQADLSWTTGEGNDINLADLDLLFVTDVVINGSVVEDFEVFAISENTTGFESLLLRQDDDDDEYYIMVAYYEGEIAVDFIVAVNSTEFDNELIEGSFDNDEEGAAIFYGPIVKSGSEYSARGRRTAPTLRKQKLTANQITALKKVK